MTARNLMRVVRGALVWTVVTGTVSCAAPLNFTNRDGPRFTGCGGDTTIGWPPRKGSGTAGFPRGLPPGDELRIVSFNIRFSEEIDRAIAVLESDPDLRYADVLLLQEMDVPGVRRIAEALGTCWVYYPAVLHPSSGRPFGNAVLSRHPFRDDHKVLLPHLGQFGRTQRIAVGTTLDVDGVPVRVYSLHLATTVELGPSRRRDQARAVLEDAAAFPGPVLIGGDLNDKSLGEVFENAGYEWITRDLGNTTRFAGLDHFLLRGLEAAAGASVGKSPDPEGASDHVPIWIRLRKPVPGRSPRGGARRRLHSSRGRTGS